MSSKNKKLENQITTVVGGVAMAIGITTLSPLLFFCGLITLSGAMSPQKKKYSEHIEAECR